MLRMEVVCDDRLRIWHVMFGCPGSKNDISIMQQSSLFNDKRTEHWPPVKLGALIAGTMIDWFYFLADGIYPRFRIFAKPHPNPRSKKEKLYTACHSSARKTVERIFAAFYGQFEILDRSARLSDLNVLKDIVKCCSILHNMVAEERGYAGTAKFRMSEQELHTGATVYDVISHPNGC